MNPSPSLDVQRFEPVTRDGWRLDMTRFKDLAAFDRGRPPVVFVPGFGMNAFVLSYHPSGISMVEYLASHGHEVWTANLRGQGGARSTTARRAKVGFSQLIQIDLQAVADTVTAHTQTKHDAFVWAGCSLGASLLYGRLALSEAPQMCGMIALGGPLQWREVPRIARLLLGSTRLVASVPVRGTRRAARMAIPLLRRTPRLLSMYMNAQHTDLNRPDLLAQTVDDPATSLSVQISKWIKHKDLVVDGVNVTQALARRAPKVPLLCIFANKDGVVPPSAALSAVDVFDADQTTVVAAGDARHWYAHADLFIGREALPRVFDPMQRWLDKVCARA